MIGQDPVGKGNSFLQRDEVNEPIPPPEGTCPPPPPLDLGKIHEELNHEWKAINLPLAKTQFKNYACRGSRKKKIL